MVDDAGPSPSRRAKQVACAPPTADPTIWDRSGLEPVFFPFPKNVLVLSPAWNHTIELS